MTRLVRGNGVTDQLQRFIPCRPSQLGHIMMRHLGRPLLKGGVHKSAIRIIGRAGIKPFDDQVLNRHLHRPQIHSTGEIKVAVQQISVPVFLSRPTPGPVCPGAGVRSAAITHALKSVQQRLVRGQSFLGDHITHQHHQQFIGNSLCLIPQLAHLFRPVFPSGFRQIIAGLPAILHRIQQLQLGRHQGFHPINNFPLCRV